MKKDALRQLFQTPEPENGGEKKRPNPVIVWILIAAIAFLAVSSFWGGKKKEPSEQSKTETPAAEQSDKEEYLRQMEERLAKTLEKIDGAGTVSVFINIESGGEKILATDQNRKSSSETRSDTAEVSEEQEQSVVLSGQSTGQSPYVVGEKMPVPGGVLVVAEGAKDEKVRCEMYEAVRALFGLSAHRIKITY